MHGDRIYMDTRSLNIITSFMFEYFIQSFLLRRKQNVQIIGKL